MKRINPLLLLLFVFLYACAGKNAYNSEESFLWKVESGSSPASYLLGTVHINKIGYKLPAKVVKAMGETGILFTEANMHLSNDEKEVLALYMINFERNTNILLGEELFMKTAERTGIAPEVLAQTKLWAIAAMLASGEPEGLSVEWGVDVLATAEADMRGMEKMYLESTVETVEHFMSIPDEQLHEVIASYINHADESQEMTRLLVDYYNSNAVNKTRKLAAELETPDSSDEFWSDWFNNITVERNKKWMRVIEPVIKDNSAFIAVGALHLFGEGGLIDLLSQKGYTLTPVL